MKTDVQLCLYRTEFFWEWQFFSEKLLYKIKVHILCSITILENYDFYGIKCEKYCRVGEATDDDIAHWHSLLDT